MNEKTISKKPWNIRCLIFSIAGMLSANSLAGYRTDHFLAWINHEQTTDGIAISKKIYEFSNSERIDSKCKIEWANNGSLLYFNNKRLKISRDLTRRVFIQQDAASFNELSRILRSFRDPADNVRDGLDGLIFYDEEHSFRMMSFTAGAKKIKIFPSALKATTSTDVVEHAFCSLFPPIVRAP